jgi:hypothetical protein
MQSIIVLKKNHAANIIRARSEQVLNNEDAMVMLKRALRKKARPW